MAKRAPLAASLALLAAGAIAIPASASPEKSAAFVDVFAKTCVPQRLSYEGTVEQAKAEGWSEVSPEKHPEFAAVMAKSAEGLEEAKEEGLEIGFQSKTYYRPHGEGELFLVVSFSTSEYLNEIGCYLYDFEATEAVLPDPVNSMLSIKPAQHHADETLTGWAWGPPPKMPRTLDTYLTFIPPGSPHVEASGFDGVVPKFTISAPDS